MIKRLLSTTSLKANIVANFVGTGWTAIIGILFIPIFLKYIGAEGYGLIGVFATLQVILTLLDSGLSDTLNKELAQRSVQTYGKEKIRNFVYSLERAYLLLSTLITLVAIGTSLILSNYWINSTTLSRDVIQNCFLLMSFGLFFQFPIGFYSGGYLGLQKHVGLNSIKVIFTTTKNIGAAILVIYVSNSVIYFFLWNLIISIPYFFVLRYGLFNTLPKSSSPLFFDRKELFTIKRFALGVSGLTLSSILFSNLDKIILSKVLSLKEFGYYTIAVSIAMVSKQLVNPLYQAYFPRLSSLVSLKDEQQLSKTYHEGSQFVAVLMITTCLVFAFFSREILTIWINNEEVSKNIWFITSILTLGVLFNSLINIPFALSIANGNTTIPLKTNLYIVFLSIPAIIISSLLYGGLGGAICWTTLNLYYVVVLPISVHRKYLQGEVMQFYLYDIFLPLVGSLFVILLLRSVLMTGESQSTLITVSKIGGIWLLSFLGSFLLANKLRKFIKPIYNSWKYQLLNR